MIELSLSVLVFAILIAAVVQGSKIIKKAKLTSARNASISSPVNFIANVSGWYDATAAGSFDGSKGEPSSGAVTYWKNVAKTSSSQVDNIQTQDNSDNQPSYVVSSLRSLPYISFGGDDKIPLNDGAFPSGNSPYTVFIVASAEDSGTILTSGSGSNINKFSFGSSGQFVISDGGASDFEFGTSGLSQMQIITHTYDGTTSNTSTNKVWINGTSVNANSGPSSGAAKTTTTTNVAIGAAASGMNGNIGEIVFFNRELRTSERQDIEKYLRDKWHLTQTPTIAGIIECTVSSDTGYSGGTVSYNTSAQSASCDSGYVGTVTIPACTTNGATLTPTVDCTSTGSISCAVSSVTGYGGGSVDYSTSSQNVSCDSGYTGTLTVAACTSSTTLLPSGTCIQSCSAASVTNGTVADYSNSASGGYYASGTTATLTCDSGYVENGTTEGTCTSGSWDFGTCEAITCTGSGTGFTSATVSYQATAGNDANYECDSGYSGDPEYTCTTDGDSVTVSGCTADAPSTSGGTISYVCDGLSQPNLCIAATTSYKVHTFTSSGTFTVSGDAISNVNYLIVGGGGGGNGGVIGNHWGTGGGGGQVRTGTFSSMVVGSFPVIIGTGGVGVPIGSSVATSNGGDSSFNSITSSGGETVVSTTTRGGNSGSGNSGSSTNGGAGAGDGAGGGSGSSGVGGVGTLWSFNGTYYGGGGGGGPGGAGGTGGGGAGTSNGPGGSGTTNTGGGGGGTGSSGSGGNGGSGIVIAYYSVTGVASGCAGSGYGFTTRTVALQSPAGNDAGYSCDSGYIGTPSYSCTTNGSSVTVTGCTLDQGSASGGSLTTTTVDGRDYNVHTFTSSGTFTVSSDLDDVQYLIVGGGGGGNGGVVGNHWGTGGGGGEVLSGSISSLSAGSFTITVGEGAAGVVAGVSTTSGNGGDSSFNSITASGGETVASTITRGGNSGSGNSGSSSDGGGGGGDSVGGGSGSSGAGGAGTPWSFNGIYYGGGGGGGPGGAGGTGGGGTGTSSGTGGAGTANRGGGGAGTGNSGGTGGAGGSGVVIIVYPTS